MHPSAFFYLLWGNVKERPARSLSLVLTVAFAVFIAVLLLEPGRRLLRESRARVQEMFPPGELTVKPRQLNVAMLALNTGVITDETIEQLRTLPGVGRVVPQLALRMPLRVEGDIAGQTITTDAVMAGIDPGMVAEDVARGYRFAYDRESSQPLPVVAPRLLLEAYNLGYSESMGLPKLNDAAVIGRKIRLFLGDSYLFAETAAAGERQMVLECEIVGITNSPQLMTSVFIPMDAARDLNSWHSGRGPGPYTLAHVRVDDLARVDTVTSAAQEMGLVVEGRRETFERVQSMLTAVMSAAVALGSAVVLLALFAVVQLQKFVAMERAGEVALVRAIGGSRLVAMRLYGAEAALLSALGALIGVAGAVWASGVLAASGGALVELAGVSAAVFTVGPVAVVLAVAGAVVVVTAIQVILMLAGLRGELLKILAE